MAGGSLNPLRPDYVWQRKHKFTSQTFGQQIQAYKTQFGPTVNPLRVTERGRLKSGRTLSISQKLLYIIIVSNISVYSLESKSLNFSKVLLKTMIYVILYSLYDYLGYKNVFENMQNSKNEADIFDFLVRQRETRRFFFA